MLIKNMFEYSFKKCWLIQNKKSSTVMDGERLSFVVFLLKLNNTCTCKVFYSTFSTHLYSYCIKKLISSRARWVIL